MKNSKSSWILFCMLLVALWLPAQSGMAQSRFLTTQYEDLPISYLKTTSIVFPYAIKSVDKGSQDVLVQKAKAVENVLLVKAAKENFQQTNLTVVTADGKLFGFTLSYDESCPVLNLVMDNTMGLNQDIMFSSENENQKQLQQYALLALSKKVKIRGLKAKRFDIKVQLSGLFIHQDIMYCRMVLGNDSPIGYDVDQLRFFIGDQKKSRRTAWQEIEFAPLLATQTVSRIPAISELIVVFAIPKFTIPEKKYLSMQLMEKNGDRHITLEIKNSDLAHIEVLNM